MLPISRQPVPLMFSAESVEHNTGQGETPCLTLSLFADLRVPLGTFLFGDYLPPQKHDCCYRPHACAGHANKIKAHSKIKSDSDWFENETEW